MALPLAALACLLTAACHTSTTPATSASRPLAVIVSCDTAGWIVPCGCSSKQAGGLLRRASYVEGIRKAADVVLADAGGAPGGASAYDRLKFESVLRGEIQMQTHAHNVGAAEAELGAAALRELADKLHAPLISTNVRDSQGEPIVATHQLFAIRSQRIAIAGVLSPKYGREGLRIDDPQEALMRLIRSLNGQFDRLLVLAYLPEEELEALASRIPEADMIVGGPTQQTIAPRRSGPTTWAATTNRGKFLVHLERSTPGATWEGKIVELSPDYPDDSAQVANLKRFREELARRDFTADQTGFAHVLSADSPKDFQVAGTQACQSCHANDCQQWSQTRHAHAWQTLVEKGANMDPYCQHCHATGYGLPGGFTSMATGTQRQDVGCESCHGPGQAHVLRPASRTIYNASDQCIQCHDHENSPQFNYEQFWEKIAHGEPVSAARDE